MSKQAEIPGVAAVIAVASGKGGVGKSTTALNLALGLRDLGLRVGLLDADIYGPSVPRLTGINEKPPPRRQQEDDSDPAFRPCHHVDRLSGRGRHRDDLARANGDVGDHPDAARRGVGHARYSGRRHAARHGRCAIDAGAERAATGAAIISTPQDLSLIDARRGLAMFKKVNVPVLGIVENMSYFQCPECGTRSDIFGHGGARHEAERLGVPFLGEIPLHMAIRTTSDDGNPVVASEPDGPHAATYRAIGTRVRDQLQGAIAAARGPYPPLLRLWFNQCSHAFVAFSIANFRVKAAPPERPGMTWNSSRRRTARGIWETPRLKET